MLKKRFTVLFSYLSWNLCFCRARLVPSIRPMSPVSDHDINHVIKHNFLTDSQKSSLGKFYPKSWFASSISQCAAQFLHFLLKPKEGPSGGHSSPSHPVCPPTFSLWEWIYENCIHLNCELRNEYVNDHHSYECYKSSNEMKAWKNSAWIFF